LEWGSGDKQIPHSTSLRAGSSAMTTRKQGNRNGKATAKPFREYILFPVSIFTDR
jgi:hypothetical protein